jgi:hypothetical protein
MIGTCVLFVDDYLNPSMISTTTIIARDSLFTRQKRELRYVSVHFLQTLGYISLTKNSQPLITYSVNSILSIESGAHRLTTPSLV